MHSHATPRSARRTAELKLPKPARARRAACSLESYQLQTQTV
jgi:hypothetical protein